MAEPSLKQKYWNRLLARFGEREQGKEEREWYQARAIAAAKRPENLLARKMERARARALLRTKYPPRAGLTDPEVEFLKRTLKTPKPLPSTPKALEEDKRQRQLAMYLVEETFKFVAEVVVDDRGDNMDIDDSREEEDEEEDGLGDDEGFDNIDSDSDDDEDSEEEEYRGSDIRYVKLTDFGKIERMGGKAAEIESKEMDKAGEQEAEFESDRQSEYSYVISELEYESEGASDDEEERPAKRQRM